MFIQFFVAYRCIPASLLITFLVLAGAPALCADEAPVSSGDKASAAAVSGESQPSPPSAPAPAPLTGGSPPPAPVAAPRQETPPLPGAPAALAQGRPVVVGAPTLVYRDDILTEDTVWRGTVQVEGGVTVASQATLTVEPGTVVRFARNAVAPGMEGVLLVEGRLVATGSEDRPIIFTSPFAEARKGDWQGLVFLGSDKKNVLEHCRVEGGAVGIDASFSTLTLRNTLVVASGTGVRCQDCLLAVTGGGTQRCGTGLDFRDSEIDLRDFIVTGNRRGIVAARSSLALTNSVLDGNEDLALAADASRLAIVSSTVTAGGSGLLVRESEGNVTANRISGNKGFGIHLGRARVKVNANTIERNGGNGIEVEDGSAIAWDNALVANGGYDCFNGSDEDFRAIGNWWGGGDAASVGARVYDRQKDATKGRVLYWPTLRDRPETRP